MFPVIDNKSGLQGVKNALEARQKQFSLNLCIIEALELCLKCNNSPKRRNIFSRLTGLPKVLILICLVHIVTLPLNNLRKKC